MTDKCPVTNKEVVDVEGCRKCVHGWWFACPMRQEIIELEEYDACRVES